MCPRSSTAAGDEHVAVHPEEVLAVEPRLLHLLQRLDRLGLAYCHVDTSLPGRRTAWTLPARPAGERPGRPRLPPLDLECGVAMAKRNWIQEERRRTLGDWVAFCPSCGHVVRYFEDLEDGAADRLPSVRDRARRAMPVLRRAAPVGVPGRVRGVRRRAPRRTSSSAARSGAPAARLGRWRCRPWRPEAGFAGREAKDGWTMCGAEGGGSWGNHGFPHAQNIVPTICEKRITVTVSSSETGRLYSRAEPLDELVDAPDLGVVVLDLTRRELAERLDVDLVDHGVEDLLALAVACADEHGDDHALAVLRRTCRRAGSSRSCGPSGAGRPRPASRS